MLTVTISVIDRSSVVYERHYKWLKRHLYEPLQIISMSFKYDTQNLFSICIKHPANNKHGFEVITIFVDGYDTIYKIEGELPWTSQRS